MAFYLKALENQIIQRGSEHKDLIGYYKNVSDLYYLMGNNEQGELYKTKANL